MSSKQRYYRYLACVLTMSLSMLAVGQPVKQTQLVGQLTWHSCDSAAFQAFLRGLGELGHQLGESIIIECRSADGDYPGLATAAADLVQLGVDVIVSLSQPAGEAAHNATNTIPIVTIVSGDPVGAGLAKSLASPGGNLTGVSYYATELTAKRLRLLQTMIPKLATIGVLANPATSHLPFEEDTKRAADQLGIALRIHPVSESSELTQAFVEMKAENVQAVFVLPDLMLASEASRIAALGLEHRLPTMAWGPWFRKWCRCRSRRRRRMPSARYITQR